MHIHHLNTGHVREPNAYCMKMEYFFRSGIFCGREWPDQAVRRLFALSSRVEQVQELAAFMTKKMGLATLRTKKIALTTLWTKTIALTTLFTEKMQLTHY